MNRLAPMLLIVAAFGCWGYSVRRAVAAAPRLASGSPTNLGPLTSAAPPAPLPLGGFRPVHTVLRTHHKLELLLVEGEQDPNSMAERWPLVKALDQFGILERVRVVDHRCTTVRVGPAAGSRFCSLPGFDLSHTVLHGRYVALRVRDVVDTRGRLHEHRLTARERRLFDQYVLPATRPRPFYSAEEVWPTVAVGGYLRAGVVLLIPGDLEALSTSPFGFTGLSFKEVQKTLQQGRPADRSVPPTVVLDLNAEANLLIALICQGDGRQPMGVCHRPAITRILAHLR